MTDSQSDNISPLNSGINRTVFALHDRLILMPLPIRVLLSLLLLSCVALLDAATGSEVSFSVFYLAPVAFAGGIISRKSGLLLALLSAATWGYLDFKAGHSYSAGWIPFWNSGVRLVFFLIVNELIDMLRRSQEYSQRLSRTDALTRLANRRVFQEHTDRVIKLARRNGRPFTLTYIDLDRFKQVNDKLGHSEGDRLLRTVADLIGEYARNTDIVARLGGDEFAILMPETGMEPARLALQRIATAVADNVENQWGVGATFGAVTFNKPPENVDAAIHQADTLMYRGKEQGRGCILQEMWP